MFIVETIAKIRRHHFVDGKKIKEICRDLDVSRNTVRKILRSGATEHIYKRSSQPLPQLGEYVVRVEELLELDCDVLIPAAKEDQITSHNANKLKCRIIAEAGAT